MSMARKPGDAWLKVVVETDSQKFASAFTANARLDLSVTSGPFIGPETPGSQSLMAHLKNSGFIILSGDVVHLEENFEKNTVPSLNTDKAASIASMDKIRRMIATYRANLFINHDKAQSDTLKLLPAFYD